MQLFTLTPAQLSTISGVARGYCQMRFDLGPSTTTKTPVYQDADGDAPHANPVIADSSGLFPAIYYDPDIASYRVRVDVAGGDFSDPLWEGVFTTPNTSDDITVGTGAGQVGLNDGANTISGNRTVSGNNTYTGTNTHSGSETFTGPLALPAAATVGGERAGWREIPMDTQDTDYTLTLTDAGRGKRKTGTAAVAITIPPHSSVAFPVGTTIYLRNAGASAAMTVVRGAAVVLRIAGVATDAGASIAAYGEGTITQEASDIWVVRGTAIT